MKIQPKLLSFTTLYTSSSTIFEKVGMKLEHKFNNFNNVKTLLLLCYETFEI